MAHLILIPYFTTNELYERPIYTDIFTLNYDCSFIPD